MKKYNIKDMVNGWEVGNFDPSVLKTEKFEVGYHKYKKGAPTQNHYYKKSTEINIVVSGDVEINGERFREGEIFVLEPYSVSESSFHKNTDLIVIRDASYTDDKYIINE